MQSELILEPNLFFYDNKPCINPKVGLLNYGPFGRFSKSSNEPLIIRAGAITTKRSKLALDNFLEALKSRINEVESGIADVDFPGISNESPLIFSIQLDESCIQYISETEIANLATFSEKDRIVEALKIYELKFSDLATTADPKPDIVFLPLSDKLIDLCEDKKYNTGKIIYERRTFMEEKEYEDVELFDFHNAIKVIAFKHNLVTQIIQPDTLIFKGDQSSATTAWNFVVSTYYKATGIPWKLADMDDETCYVGISFYQEINGQEKNMRASMAQVFLNTGESQVIRGKPFKWDKNTGRSPSLSTEHAYEIIKDVIDLYKRQKNNNLPKRIVVHKTSQFNNEEIEGFNKGTIGIEIVDYIHIHNIGIMLCPEGEDYPPIRGTFIHEGNQFLLYTTGYVPSLGTYMGASVPKPIFIEAYRNDSNPLQIAKDIMALTKLDWNNANFNSRLPVTISVSRKVGNILSESKARGIEPPPSYKFYM